MCSRTPSPLPRYLTVSNRSNLSLVFCLGLNLPTTTANSIRAVCNLPTVTAYRRTPPIPQHRTVCNTFSLSSTNDRPFDRAVRCASNHRQPQPTADACRQPTVRSNCSTQPRTAGALDRSTAFDQRALCCTRPSI